MHAFKPRTWDAEAGRFEFKTSLIYIQSEFQDKPRKEKHCLSKKINKYTNK